MLGRIRAVLRRRRWRATVLCAVVLLGAVVTTAHTSGGHHHMGQAAAMCLAVLAAGAAAAAAVPALGRLVPQAPRPVDARCPHGPILVAVRPPWRPRGDPALLQVFRR
jgi:peptidoglycan/LPS O-acetylase OafA/YrhL